MPFAATFVRYDVDMANWQANWAIPSDDLLSAKNNFKAIHSSGQVFIFFTKK